MLYKIIFGVIIFKRKSHEVNQIAAKEMKPKINKFYLKFLLMKSACDFMIKKI